MDRADACARSGESCRVPDRPGSSPGPPSVPLQDRSRGIEFALATRNRTTCSCAFLLSSCSPSGVYRTPSRRCQRLVRSWSCAVTGPPAVIFSVSIDARRFVLAEQSFPFEVCVPLDMNSRQALIRAAHPGRRHPGY